METNTSLLIAILVVAGLILILLIFSLTKVMAMYNYYRDDPIPPPELRLSQSFVHKPRNKNSVTI